MKSMALTALCEHAHVRTRSRVAADGQLSRIVTMATGVKNLCLFFFCGGVCTDIGLVRSHSYAIMCSLY